MMLEVPDKLLDRINQLNRFTNFILTQNLSEIPEFFMNHWFLNNQLRTIILYMGEHYFIIMANFLGNFLSDLKKNIPFLKSDKVNSEVVIGIVLHLILFICILILLYLLAKQFQLL
jgi:hypothetical protein